MNEIFLYGPVGGWLCGFTAADLALALRSMGDVKLRVHSEGGDAMEGIAVANVVRAHKGKVVVQVDGLCASAATPVLCTADEVIIAPGGLVMLTALRKPVPAFKPRPCGMPSLPEVQSAYRAVTSAAVSARL